MRNLVYIIARTLCAIAFHSVENSYKINRKVQFVAIMLQPINGQRQTTKLFINLPKRVIVSIVVDYDKFGLIHKKRNSSANTLELCPFGFTPSI